MSGAVEGQAVWPSNQKPVAWQSDADMMRLRLGLYHIKDKVSDGEVEYKNVAIEGPYGTIRTSAKGVTDHGSPEGIVYVGCVKDNVSERILENKYSNDAMTPEVIK